MHRFILEVYHIYEKYNIQMWFEIQCIGINYSRAIPINVGRKIKATKTWYHQETSSNLEASMDPEELLSNPEELWGTLRNLGEP